MLIEDRGRPDEAVSCYERAVHVEPELAEAHYNLALLYDRAGKKREAVRHLAIFRRLSPRRR